MSPDAGLIDRIATERVVLIARCEESIGLM